MKKVIVCLLSVVILVMMLLPADIAMARGRGHGGPTASNRTTESLVADFDFSVCYSCSRDARISVTFTDESSGGVPTYKYDWDFGDGSEHSSGRNPKHRYDGAGNYTVTLTITDRARNVATTSQTITLGSASTENIEPVSSNSSTKAVGTWPRCNDGCTANDATIVDAWLVVDSTDCNPGQDNSAELWVTFDINRDKGPWCIVSVMDIYVDGVLTYGEYTTAVGDLPGSNGWEVKIGDVTWPCGSELEIRDIHVQWHTHDGDDCVWGNCSGYIPSKCWDYAGPMYVRTPLVADFEFNNVCFCNNTVFTDTTTGGAEPYTSWYWDFGDGGDSTEQNPMHHYDQPGTYTVTLTVTDSDYISDSQSHDVTIYLNPAVNLTGDTSFCEENTVITANVAGGTPDYTYDWSASTAPGIPNDGSYTATGSGTVEVTVTDAHGCTGSDSVTVVFEDCDDLDYYTDWEYYCVDDSIWRTRDLHDFYCLDGVCLEDVVPESEWFEDCPADYYTDWQYYCVGDSIWRTRDLHDFYCLDGVCLEDVIPESEWFEDCPADYYTDWQYYCVGDSIWRTRDLHDFYCLDGACLEDVVPESEWFEDCPADYYTDWQYYCVGDSIWRTRDFHDLYCLDGVCHENVTPETEWVEDITATASSNSPVNQGATIQLYGGPDGMDTYYWTGPGGWTSDVQNPARSGATTAMAGTYTLTVTNEYGCSDDDTTNVEVRVPQVTPAAAAGCPSTKYLTVDWEGCITSKVLYSNDRLAVDLLGPSPDLSHSLLLERGTLAPIVNGQLHYIIFVRELEEIPPVPENTVALVVFNITPAGAMFDRDIFLTLGLNQTQLPQNALNVTMAYYDSVNGRWEELDYEAGGPDGVAEITLSASINHFSIFGVLAQLTSTHTQPAHFVSSGLNIVPSVEKTTFMTKTGESATITANIFNDGWQEGTFTAVLKLNGQTVDSKMVTVPAGQSKQVSFTQSGLDHGKYEVEIAGLTGEFTASRTITWWLIIVIIAAIGLIIWGVVWGRKRRRKAQQEA